LGGATHRRRGCAAGTRGVPDTTALDQDIGAIPADKDATIAQHVVIAQHNQPIESATVRQMVSELNTAVPHCDVVWLHPCHPTDPSAFPSNTTQATQPMSMYGASKR